ncbi:UNVERIFIED_CONTAM: Floricaula protein [Sesamum calycinum]|uniref:Floricaula/leafy-like transcription factor n=1 Tax=Sesamum calycinum TaxID=2727403 RepID=A0AAW2NG87_9LAMI
MDPDAFSASFFKWDPRATLPPPNRLLEAVAPPPPPPPPAYSVRPRELGELDEMMNSLCQIFRWDLLVGERYGIKAAVRAERRRLDEEEARRRHLLSGDTTHALDALSQEGLSEEPVQQEKEAAGSGGGGVWEMVVAAGGRKQRRRKNYKGRSRMASMEEDDDDDETEGAEDDENCGGGGGSERQREHPFIVTEPGEVARGKKNGLDYLFHLYEQCREFLMQVQSIAKERGEKCPSKCKNIEKMVDDEHENNWIGEKGKCGDDGGGGGCVSVRTVQHGAAESRACVVGVRAVHMRTRQLVYGVLGVSANPKGPQRIIPSHIHTLFPPSSFPLSTFVPIN